MLGEAEQRLLHVVMLKERLVLRDLFSEKDQRYYNLRPAPHGFNLPFAKDNKNYRLNLAYYSLNK